MYISVKWVGTLYLSYFIVPPVEKFIPETRSVCSEVQPNIIDNESTTETTRRYIEDNEKEETSFLFSK